MLLVVIQFIDIVIFILIICTCRTICRIFLLKSSSSSSHGSLLSSSTQCTNRDRSTFARMRCVVSCHFLQHDTLPHYLLCIFGLSRPISTDPDGQKLWV